MTNEDNLTGRDFRVMWRTVTVAAIVIATCIGSILYAVVWATRHDERLGAVEKWQNAKDHEAARELWRRDRAIERAPLPAPKG